MTKWVIRQIGVCSDCESICKLRLLHNKSPGEAPQSIEFHRAATAADAWLTMQASHFSKIRRLWAMRVVECAMCFLWLYFPACRCYGYIHVMCQSLCAPARELIPWNKCTNNMHLNIYRWEKSPCSLRVELIALCVCFTPTISQSCDEKSSSYANSMLNIES